MLRYFQFDQSYFFLFATIKKAFPFVAKYLIGILPLFIGFAFLGMALFWASDRFSTFNLTFFT